MLGWLKSNRLKVASFSAVLADIFMGLAGGVGLFHVSFANPAYIAMSVGGCVGLLGHAALLFWGKGAKPRVVSAQDALPPSILLKPFFPWRYPLDFAFSLFIVSNILYLSAGLYLGLYALAIGGILAAIASAIGWMWPHEKPIGPFTSMQVTSLFYAASTFNHFVAGLGAMNVWIILSACCYLVCNIIFFTVRKENQSTYTQQHEL